MRSEAELVILTTKENLTQKHQQLEKYTTVNSFLRSADSASLVPDPAKQKVLKDFMYFTVQSTGARLHMRDAKEYFLVSIKHLNALYHKLPKQQKEKADSIDLAPTI